MIAVFKKEVYRIFSDKKLIFTTFILPPLIMVVLYSVIIFLASSGVMSVNKSSPKILINNAPEFAKKIEGYDESYSQGKTTEELAAIYKEDKLNLVVSFPEDFENQVDNFKPGSKAPEIVVLCNTTNDYSERALKSFTKDYLEEFGRKTIAKRIGGEENLVVYNISDQSIQQKVLDSKQISGRIISGIVPYFLFIFIFASGMGLITESIAGEKERGTLATQLLTPVSREGLALGKMLGLSLLSLVATITTMMGMVIVGIMLKFIIPPEATKDLSIVYGLKEYLLLVIVLVPTMFMNTTLMMVFSALGKNMKEAQGYIMPLYFLTIIVASIPMYAPAGDAAQIWKYMIPIYGQVTALSEILGYKANMLGVTAAAVVPLIITMVMVFIIKNIFNNERMIVSD